MKDMKKFFTFLMLFIAVTMAAKDYELTSPSGEVRVLVNVQEKITYSVQKGQEQLLSPSVIRMDFKNMKLSTSVRKASWKTVDEQLKAIVPVKFRIIRDYYNELRLSFRGGWSLVFRAYDNGVAYRFETSFSPKEVFVIDETSELNFADDFQVYWTNENRENYITHCEAFFREMPLSSIDRKTYSYLPLSLRTPKGTRIVVTESDLSDYPNMFVHGDGEYHLVSEWPEVILSYDMKNDRDVIVREKADYIAATDGSRTYPWRIMTIGDDRDLLENTLPWQLASKQVSQDVDWIRPGKISWEWWSMLNVYGVDFKAGVNTETYKYYVDFAATYGLEYILMDEGWSVSTTNVIEPQPDLDLHEIIRYAESKGVGVVLWTLWTPIKSDMEHILDTYHDWGVKGIKIDFMQMTDQNMVNFYEDVARECFKRHLLVDYHGAFKPAGLQRKYPNAMTFEGVYGMEHDKCSNDISPEHDLVLPFTRMVAGPMDYTPGATINATKGDFSIRWEHPMSQGTRAHQAAIFTAFESPLTMLCDSPSNYYKNHEFTSYIASIPTVWDETRALKAKAGDYLLIARRNGNKWYVAGLNDWTARKLSFKAEFLGDGEYEVKILRDGVNADRWAEDYKIEDKTAFATSVFDIEMAPGGGWSAIFTPVPKSGIRYVDADKFPLFGQISDKVNNRYERLPATLETVSREPVWYLGRQSAGMYIRFASNSTSISARWTSMFGVLMPHMTPVGTRGLDLYALENEEWKFVCSAQPFNGSLRSERKIISNMEPVEREYMLYLPLYDGVSSLEIGVDEDAFIAPPFLNTPSIGKPIVMYGTSILQGGCANRPGMAHTNIISRRLDRVVYNLGFSGNAFLDYEIAELMAEVDDPGAFVLDYLPNASISQINEKGERFFNILRERHPNVPIIFLDDPLYPTMYYDKTIYDEVNRKNTANRAFFERLHQKGVKNIWYIKSDDLIGTDREATVDGIHFTDLGAMRYVDVVIPILKKAMNEQ